MFCTQIFELTCKDKRSRDLVTVGPISPKNMSKVAQDLKEKKSSSGGAPSICVPEQSEKSWMGEGGRGGMMAPPGLIRVKRITYLYH